jgi:hypothetical protein
VCIVIFLPEKGEMKNDSSQNSELLFHFDVRGRQVDCGYVARRRHPLPTHRDEDHLGRVVREGRSVKVAVESSDFETGACQQVFQLEAEEIAHGQRLDDATAVNMIDELAVCALIGVPLSKHPERPAQPAAVRKAEFRGVFYFIGTNRSRKQRQIWIEHIEHQTAAGLQMLLNAAK